MLDPHRRDHRRPGELFVGVVHKIGTRAENRVEGEILADLRRVRGKQNLLFRLAEAAVEHPDEIVRQALFPVVSEATLRDLVAEAKANEAAFKTRVRKVLRSSYSSHYRRMLPELLIALEFRSNNKDHQPVIGRPRPAAPLRATFGGGAPLRPRGACSPGRCRSTRLA